MSDENPDLSFALRDRSAARTRSRDGCGQHHQQYGVSGGEYREVGGEHSPAESANQHPIRGGGQEILWRQLAISRLPRTDPRQEESFQ